MFTLYMDFNNVQLMSGPTHFVVLVSDFFLSFLSLMVPGTLLL